MITAHLIKEVMPRCPGPRAETFAVALNEAVAAWDISTPRRIAAFLAQIAVESVELIDLQERLSYTTTERLRAVFKVFREEVDPEPYLRNPEKLANFVYGDRGEGSTGRILGNGDEASGDGFRFRGRGPPHLTGRYWYTEIGELIRRDLQHNPDLMLDPYVGSLAAAAFFRKNGCVIPADRGAIDEVSKKFNPGGFGMVERRAAHARGLAAFGLSP